MSYQQEVNVRKIQKKSVYKAIELIHTRTYKKKRTDEEKRTDAEKEICKQISSFCISTPLNRKRKRSSTIPFSKSLLITEMKSYMACQDWRHMQYLFPLLLSCSSDLEPLLWRYAMLILLYSPNSNPSALDTFLDMCIGNNEMLDGCQILEKLLSLPCREL